MALGILFVYAEVMEMLEIGQRVRIRQDLTVDTSYGGWVFVQYMQDIAERGETYITETTDDAYSRTAFRLRSESGDLLRCVWTEEMLIPVSPCSITMEDILFGGEAL